MIPGWRLAVAALIIAIAACDQRGCGEARRDASRVLDCQYDDVACTEISSQEGWICRCSLSSSEVVLCPRSAGVPCSRWVGAEPPAESSR